MTDGVRRVVLMDAPPPHEAIGPYVPSVAAALRDYGLSAPEVFAEDDDVGLALIEDFGDETYEGAPRRRQRRARALRAGDRHAHRLAAHRRRAGFPNCRNTMRSGLAEAVLLVDWYFPAVVGQPIPAEDRDLRTSRRGGGC